MSHRVVTVQEGGVQIDSCVDESLIDMDFLWQTDYNGICFVKGHYTGRRSVFFRDNVDGHLAGKPQLVINVHHVCDDGVVSFSTSIHRKHPDDIKYQDIFVLLTKLKRPLFQDMICPARLLPLFFYF